MVSVRWSFLFLLVLRIGCVVLLWHSLFLTYNRFGLPYVVYVLCLFVYLVISHFGFDGSVWFLMYQLLVNAYVLLFFFKRNLPNYPYFVMSTVIVSCNFLFTFSPILLSVLYSQIGQEFLFSKVYFLLTFVLICLISFAVLWCSFSLNGSI